MKNVLFSLLALFVITGCKEKYNPSIHYPVTGYLVVEGFINSGAGATSIRLSRTLGLTDTTAVQAEDGAQLTVEGDDNSSVALSPQGNGEYAAGQVFLNSAGQYRLHIRTADGKEYYSGFSRSIATPPIDSLSWQRGEKGVTINIHSHDAANATRYYSWSFEETWEIHSKYVTALKFLFDSSGAVTGIGPILPNYRPDTTVKTCWSTDSSTSILTGSSAKLIQNVIDLPINFIENGSRKLSQFYSINLIQRGVSADGYEFLQRLKKNSEQTGSIFDAQPSELNSNIHNIADSSEKVFGFVEVSDAQESRLFIDAANLPDWGYAQSCQVLSIPYDFSMISQYASYAPLDLITKSDPPGSPPRSFLDLVDPICVDCRLSHAVNVKPSFWPR